jgi:hypothetical protein
MVWNSENALSGSLHQILLLETHAMEFSRNR